MSNTAMTQDAPRINGVAKTASASDAPRAAARPRTPKPPPTVITSNHHTRRLPEICHILRRKIAVFLDEQLTDGLLRDTQQQARVAMGVVEEALRRYGCGPFF